MTDKNKLATICEALPIAAGRFFSTCGDQIIEILVIWIAWQATQSSFATSIAAFSQRAPFWLFGYVGAGLTDRRSPFGVLVAASLTCTVLALAGATIGTMNATSVAVIAIAFLIGCARSFEAPALTALISATVPPVHMHQVNNILDNSKRMGRVVAPFVAGGISSGRTAWSLMIIAGCYAVMAICVKAISRARSLAGGDISIKKKGGLGSIREILGTAFVGSVIVASMFYAFFHGAAYFALIPRLFLATTDGSVTGFAQIVTMIALGGLCGNVTILALGSPNARNMVTLGMLGAGIGFGLIAVLGPYERLAAAFLVGISLPLQDVFIISLIQHYSRPDLVARGHALWRLACELTIGLGMLAGGFGADRAPAYVLLICAGVGIVVTAVALRLKFGFAPSSEHA